MESIKILHTGDLHLASPMLNMGDKALARKSELLESFSNILSLARREGVDAILIAGDLFESCKPDDATLQFVVGAFGAIKPIKVFIALGNHDYGLDATFPDNVYVFKNYIEKISVGACDIYGVSFEDEHTHRCIIEGFSVENPENINILLVHGDTKPQSAYNPIGEADIKYCGADYVALGHAHTHNGFFVTGKTSYAYCGIPEGRAFDECGDKGVIIAEVGRGYANCRFLPTCSRRYREIVVDAQGASDNIELCKKIAEGLENTEDAYRVTLVGERRCFVDCAFLKEQLEKEFYFVEITDNTTEEIGDSYSLGGLFAAGCENPRAKKYGLMALRGEKVTIL